MYEGILLKTYSPEIIKFRIIKYLNITFFFIFQNVLTKCYIVRVLSVNSRAGVIQTGYFHIKKGGTKVFFFSERDCLSWTGETRVL